MSVSGTMTKRRRRSFSPEFKREIVALCQLPDNTVASVGKEYELAETAVRRWVRQAEVDAGLKPGVTTSEVEEVARLRSGPFDLFIADIESASTIRMCGFFMAAPLYGGRARGDIRAPPCHAQKSA